MSVKDGGTSQFLPKHDDSFVVSSLPLDSYPALLPSQPRRVRQLDLVLSLLSSRRKYIRQSPGGNIGGLRASNLTDAEGTDSFVVLSNIVTGIFCYTFFFTAHRVPKIRSFLRLDPEGFRRHSGDIRSLYQHYSYFPPRVIQLER